MRFIGFVPGLVGLCLALLLLGGEEMGGTCHPAALIISASLIVSGIIYGLIVYR